MKKQSKQRKQHKAVCLAVGLSLAAPVLPIYASTQTPFATEQEVTQKTQSILSARQINPTTIEVLLSDNKSMFIDFYGDNIFRIFQDNNGGIIRRPEAKPDAIILVDNPRKDLSKLNLANDNNDVIIETDKIKLILNKQNSTMKAINLKTGQVAFEEIKPATFEEKKVTLSLKGNPNEYFYGGGVQNGRFSHKGKAISIENQNSWTDGGVASPTPFYWSTNGYGMMWHTFKKGKYDFGSKDPSIVDLHHEDNYLDVFFMINDGAVPILNDFYQLTGNPVLLPKFGFYQGHLNAYNRDYWKEDEKGILFEDGKRYKEAQKDNGGVKESLNGEKGNYQFSARAVIDRYKNHDMPLGWLLPNDGYGAGYGQTETLDGNIENLRQLAEYAQKNGVEIGLWTQSDLHPKPEISPLLQRDIVKEVKDAGVRVLKTDVAWVGAGYSFGLNGITDVAQIMTYYGNDARPFIISLDGWAGTQRYAGIWSGDQVGGVWEYIRFHIPTYIGSGLSGQPNISSDMDGIFGGKNSNVNIRDFQWKTWTPMELNMDGWGANEKYPHALGEPATSINRHYLKLKSELMPYAYSIAKESVDGLPMIRAMFLEYPNAYTLGKSTQYQFLYGPYFLVAPIYQETKMDELGNDIRNTIYLPEGQWIDYFNGDVYEGNTIINNFETPIWKLPVFVKAGAIIPMTNPNNNVAEINKNLRIYEIYPSGQTQFTEYDDDGTTEAYRQGEGATTVIKSSVLPKGKLEISVSKTEGNFKGFVANKVTEFKINATQNPKKVQAEIGNKKVKLTQVNSLEAFNQNVNVYYFNQAPELNQFAKPGSDFAKVEMKKNPQIWIKLQNTNIAQNTIEVTVDGFEYAPANRLLVSTGTLSAPANAQVSEENTEAYTLKPTWNKVSNADYYEIEFNNMLYSTIKDNELLFEDLSAETPYTFKLRAVNKDGKSDWTTFGATTKSNPLEFAIQGIQGETSCENQGGQGIAKLFDFDEGNTWHTKWGAEAVPFDVIMDLQTINQLDKFHYLPRSEKGNGILLKGKVFTSMDKKHWKEAGTFDWANDTEEKIFLFTEKPTSRYVKLEVTEGAGKYGSGTELYVFKVPGTESYLPGDINNDRLINRNDYTSYMNYTGLRRGDADFEGYISNGDLNKNDLIDAYDISVVATRLDGGINKDKVEPVEGSIIMVPSKKQYNAGETVDIVVKGKDLRSVNALSFAIPYASQDYEFVTIEPLNMKKMDNLTNDRLHTNGQKALYPTFINVGKQEALEGSMDLFVIKLKARRNVKFDLQAIDGFLVDKMLNTVNF